MYCLQKLNKLFIIFFILVSAGVSAAETKWEVAIVFRGEAEDEQFQKDIDENILELARISPINSLKIGIYREIEGRSYEYLPFQSSRREINFGDILYRQDLNQINLPGKLKQNSSVNLDGFLKTFYSNKNVKKALIIYSHGKGSAGLRNLSTSDLKDALSNLPHLDLLWFDACFMANMEFLYEMRSFSEYIISSEEAEFSSGLPFQVLNQLPSFPSAKEAAIALSKNFIESYSYIKNGSQRNYVSISSATISVVESDKLEAIAHSLKPVSSLIKNLNDSQKNRLQRILESRATMDEKSMVDLGTLLIELRKMTASNPLVALRLTSLIRLLNIEAVKKLKTNPRIHLYNPGLESKLVFGFNNWQDGIQTDVEENLVFDSIIRHDGFIRGPNQNEWPFKITKSRRMILTPFAPGLNIFNYYFLNAKNNKLLTEALSVARTYDVVESYADSEKTPLAYSAYTQQVGFKAERYTGLNITFPGSVPSLDYFEMEFNQLAEWLSL